ncbi:MAG: hypothetical protein HY075_07620 [Deltaproteobacteria bacterium]|nr:hypothetical protein [Deltaproteobacteria bacterium]
MILRLYWAAGLAFCLFIAAGQLRAELPYGRFGSASDEPGYANPSATLAGACDPGNALSDAERARMLNRLRSSRAGHAILTDFLRHYGSFANLMIQWDGVSYSQVVAVAAPGRSPAGISQLGDAVCVHLTKRLPDIEHVADLAHELTHATRLSPKVLRGEVTDVSEFVRARLSVRGGEADAFAVECQVKRELLGHWDELCSPYAPTGVADSFDTEQVVRDFYSGRLSASLTGESYPVMLSRQYKAMLAKKARVSYATNPYARK